MHVLLVFQGVSGEEFWAVKVGGSAILAERPAGKTRGQTQQHEAHMCTLCRSKHKQSVGGLSCASGRGRVGTCLLNQHMRTDTAGLSSAGTHAFTSIKAAGAHCPTVTQQRVERGVGWVEGISILRWIGSHL